MVVFTLGGGFAPVSNLLVYVFGAGGWFLVVITIITAYLIISNRHVPKYIEDTGSLPLSQSTGRGG